MASFCIGYGNDGQAVRDIYHRVYFHPEDGFTRSAELTWRVVPG